VLCLLFNETFQASRGAAAPIAVKAYALNSSAIRALCQALIKNKFFGAIDVNARALTPAPPRQRPQQWKNVITNS